MTVSALKFKHASVPKQAGERSRLKVVQGPDFGSVYVITGVKASIGRGEDTDVILSDLKSSRTHAEISLTAKGEWVVKDLGSSNGILVNGKATKSSVIHFHDTITLGETTLEFLTADAGTRLLAAPARSLGTVQIQRSALSDQRQRVQALGGAKSSASPKFFLVAAAALVLVFVLSGTDKSSQPKVAAKHGEATRDLATYLPGAGSVVASKSAETFFRAGFREYLEGNYLRAKMQFETALQIAPNHELAHLYLENCDRSIKESVEFDLERGKKSADAGKLKEARSHFESVMRLLYRDQSNPSYLEAKDLLNQLDHPSNANGGSG